MIVCTILCEMDTLQTINLLVTQNQTIQVVLYGLIIYQVNYVVKSELRK